VFPRYRVGSGAALFLVSDLLLFAEMGPLAGSVVPEILAWPIYYLGQLLIAVGVAQTLCASATPSSGSWSTTRPRAA
jgi:hypothetical protein